MRGGAPKKFFFYENALSGSIHSTYQLPSLQTDQKPTLGQPSIDTVDSRGLGQVKQCPGPGQWSNGPKVVSFARPAR